MKSNQIIKYLTITALAVSLTSCDAISSIFDAGVSIFSFGFWVGIIVLVAIIALIIWLISKAFKRNKK